MLPPEGWVLLSWSRRSTLWEELLAACASGITHARRNISISNGKQNRNQVRACVLLRCKEKKGILTLTSSSDMQFLGGEPYEPPRATSSRRRAHPTAAERVYTRSHLKTRAKMQIAVCKVPESSFARPSKAKTPGDGRKEAKWWTLP
ncbi:hypothetical protein BHE74_00038776 [Ensete ventricosum]|nr:hypothetical protein BHE74_00038776 [Ensete ventricosum]